MTAFVMGIALHCSMLRGSDEVTHIALFLAKLCPSNTLFVAMFSCDRMWDEGSSIRQLSARCSSCSETSVESSQCAHPVNCKCQRSYPMSHKREELGREKYLQHFQDLRHNLATCSALPCASCAREDASLPPQLIQSYCRFAQ